MDDHDMLYRNDGKIIDDIENAKKKLLIAKELYINAKKNLEIEEANYKKAKRYSFKNY